MSRKHLDRGTRNAQTELPFSDYWNREYPEEVRFPTSEWVSQGADDGRARPPLDTFLLGVRDEAVKFW